MIESNILHLDNELSEVVRLFEGADGLCIAHEGTLEGFHFYNRIYIEGRDYLFHDYEEFKGEVEKKSLVKRYAKLALYNVLKERFHKTLPWGALTGIRPTRLAYGEIEKGKQYEPLFEKMDVSRDNISLVRRVIEGQRGIYEKKEGNCDLYVSLPFCPTRCVYCSFITAPIDKTRQYIPAYLGALERELEGARGLMKNVRSVYIGGGTPFALETRDLERVLKMAQPYAKGAEFTVEAGRPDVFSVEKLQLCKEYGVTRICINAQSFSDKTLCAIGRKHTAAQVREAFAMAEPFHFITNCDLIAGLTDETLQEFCYSVDSAIALNPENITVHTLCLKKGAKLKEETAALSEGELSKMISYSREKLTAAGYEPYYLYRQKYMAGAHENVGWTKKGRASVYNIDVMEETTDNLAVGANAVSKKVFLQKGRIERVGSPKDIPTYLSKVDELIEKKKTLWNE